MHFRSEELGFGYDVIKDIKAFTMLAEDVSFEETFEFDPEQPHHKITVLRPKYLAQSET